MTMVVSGVGGVLLVVAVVVGVASADATTKRVTSASLASQVVSAPPPQLPASFTQSHSGGTFDVTIEVCLDENGEVERAVVLQSIGDARTDEALLAQIRRNWVYKPQPQPVCFERPYRFQLGTVQTAEPKTLSVFMVKAIAISMPGAHLPVRSRRLIRGRRSGRATRCASAPMASSRGSRPSPPRWMPRRMPPSFSSSGRGRSGRPPSRRAS